MDTPTLLLESDKPLVPSSSLSAFDVRVRNLLTQSFGAAEGARIFDSAQLGETPAADRSAYVQATRDALAEHLSVDATYPKASPISAKHRAMAEAIVFSAMEAAIEAEVIVGRLAREYVSHRMVLRRHLDSIMDLRNCFDMPDGVG